MLTKRGSVQRDGLYTAKLSFSSAKTRFHGDIGSSSANWLLSDTADLVRRRLLMCRSCNRLRLAHFIIWSASEDVPKWVFGSLSFPTRCLLPLFLAFDFPTRSGPGLGVGASKHRDRDLPYFETETGTRTETQTPGFRSRDRDRD